ncbi:hypothetical protein PROFUN_05351 [Planoprotostelium fungivorum]|uniref:Uncharacterized protein n=1 Tax=Planoprotostelium fungivorum TaxID=1890364 RepID=A0A2P6NR33_9EUKA|nr:hypothetical protein PROFUN_05351 [Planoprotostelium fungivorum]
MKALLLTQIFFMSLLTCESRFFIDELVGAEIANIKTKPPLTGPRVKQVVERAAQHVVEDIKLSLIRKEIGKGKPTPTPTFHIPPVQMVEVLHSKVEISETLCCQIDLELDDGYTATASFHLPIEAEETLERYEPSTLEWKERRQRASTDLNDASAKLSREADELLARVIWHPSIFQQIDLMGPTNVELYQNDPNPNEISVEFPTDSTSISLGRVEEFLLSEGTRVFLRGASLLHIQGPLSLEFLGQDKLKLISEGERPLSIETEGKDLSIIASDRTGIHHLHPTRAHLYNLTHTFPPSESILSIPHVDLIYESIIEALEQYRKQYTDRRVRVRDTSSVERIGGITFEAAVKMKIPFTTRQTGGLIHHYTADIMRQGGQTQVLKIEESELHKLHAVTLKKGVTHNVTLTQLMRSFRPGVEFSAIE